MGLRPKNIIMTDYLFNNSIPIPESGCWVWMGTTTKKGYGKLMINYKTIRAHRLAYEVFKGPIPENILVCHKCDTPACINPNHLFLGTPNDNIQDIIIKKRWFNSNKTHCKRGHNIMDENNIYRRPNSPLWRFCKQCRKERMREHEKGLKSRWIN